MVEVFIKYNPYKLETDVEINGKAVRENSRLKRKEKRLQEWIEELPDILKEECNDTNYHIVFHGISPDFEDLQFVANNAKSKGLNISCEHEAVTETGDKIPVIEKIFEDIQKGPFDELRQRDLINAFESAKNSEFHVDVIATMSAGKSTLINALLAHKLMPSKQAACTAKITEIKDRDELGDIFSADVYNNDHERIEHLENLTYEDMQKLNDTEEVSKIKIEGDIPFVASEDVSLVLVDTPGPNNSRNEQHKMATYEMIGQSSKALVLYILNAAQLQTNDDSTLLDYIAKNMSVGGKQSKDRFIFVVNKLDDFKTGEDSVEKALKNVKDYLEDKGIKDPNIFPASALTALEIKTVLKNVNMNGIKNLKDFYKSDDVNSQEILDDPEIEETVVKVCNLNRNDEKHLEKYAPLIPSLKNEINSILKKADNDNDSKTEALVHSGILSIEAAIRLYVEKYAKTAKIKNIVDTFNQKLETAETIEKLNKEIASNKDFADKIKQQISVIERELESGENARKFEQEISKINYKQDFSVVIKNKKNEIQAEKTKKLEASRGKLNKQQAKNACEKLTKFAEELQAKTVVELETAIFNHVQKSAQNLLDQYKQRLENLTGELETTDKIDIKPLEIMKGNLDVNVTDLIENKKLIKTEIVTVERQKLNTQKAWYKPWTWFQDEWVVIKEYENREYIDGEELAQKFLAPFEENLNTNIESAEKYATEQAQRVQEAFKEEFKKLDDVLKNKLKELSQKTQKRDDIDKAIKEADERLQWIKDIRGRIDAILEI
ncbi:MAG: dynamin family protein [Synergistaceae bacterium]|nr:dynamin family protein [Synergistaceae bacterium]